MKPSIQSILIMALFTAFLRDNIIHAFPRVIKSNHWMTSMRLLSSFYSPDSSNRDIDSESNNTHSMNVPRMTGAQGENVPKIVVSELTKQQKLKDTISEYESNTKRQVFDDTITFPSEFIIKVVGVNDSTFMSDILQLIQSNVGVQPKFLTHTYKLTADNRHVSITISPYFYNSAEIYALYDAISKDARVKFMI